MRDSATNDAAAELEHLLHDMPLPKRVVEAAEKLIAEARHLREHPLPQLLMIDEVAEYFRVSTRTIRRWIEQGRLHTVHITHGGSGRVLVQRTELRRLVEEGTKSS